MRQFSTVIEIGSGKVVSIIGEQGQYDEVHILGSASQPYLGFKNKRWLDKSGPEEPMLAALQEAEKKANKRCHKAHIGVPADFVSVILKQTEIEFQTHKVITQEDMDKLFQRGKKQLNISKRDYMLLHRCPVRYTLDGARNVMVPIGKKCKRLSAIISYVVVERRFATQISDILTDYGIATSTFISSSYAEAMYFIPESKRDHGAIMVDIGATSTALMVVHGDGLIYHRVLPFGGNNITNDLIRVLGIEKSVAEELKKRAIFGLSLGDNDFYEVCDTSAYSFIRFSAVRVQEIIEARLTEMLNVIQYCLEKSECNLQHYIPLYVAGGTASMRGLREFIQKYTDRTTVIVQPQSTCFNQPAYASVLAVCDRALKSEIDEPTHFFDSIKNLFHS